MVASRYAAVVFVCALAFLTAPTSNASTTDHHEGSHDDESKGESERVPGIPPAAHYDIPPSVIAEEVPLYPKKQGTVGDDAHTVPHVPQEPTENTTSDVVDEETHLPPKEATTHKEEEIPPIVETSSITTEDEEDMEASSLIPVGASDLQVLHTATTGLPSSHHTDFLEGSGDTMEPEERGTSLVSVSLTPTVVTVSVPTLPPSTPSRDVLTSGCSERLCKEIYEAEIVAKPTTVKAAAGSDVEFVCSQKQAGGNDSHWFKLRWDVPSESGLLEKQTGGTGRAIALFGRVNAEGTTNYTCSPDLPIGCCSPEKVGATVVLVVYTAQTYTAHVLVVSALTVIGVAFCVFVHYSKRKAYAPVDTKEREDWELKNVS